jgi:hypothetical protein
MTYDGTQNRLPPQVRQTIKRLIDAKRTAGPVSITELAVEIHRICPTTQMQEAELRAAIAAQAVQAGCMVDFDRP